MSGRGYVKYVMSTSRSLGATQQPSKKGTCVPRVTESQRNTVLELLAGGKSLRDVAFSTGLTYGQVYDVKRKACA